MAWHTRANCSGVNRRSSGNRGVGRPSRSEGAGADTGAGSSAAGGASDISPRGNATSIEANRFSQPLWIRPPHHIWCASWPNHRHCRQAHPNASPRSPSRATVRLRRAHRSVCCTASARPSRPCASAFWIMRPSALLLRSLPRAWPSTSIGPSSFAVFVPRPLPHRLRWPARRPSSPKRFDPSVRRNDPRTVRFPPAAGTRTDRSAARETPPAAPARNCSSPTPAGYQSPAP